MHVKYYSQSASPGGLLITEATAISPEGRLGYKSVPGIWTAHQVGEWRKVTAAMHSKGV
jgi:N-ethylmaleimide reductase